MHSYGMQMDNLMPFLPREAFLTECRNPSGLYLSVEKYAQPQPGISGGTSQSVRIVSLGRKERTPIMRQSVRTASLCSRKRLPIIRHSFGLHLLVEKNVYRSCGNSSGLHLSVENMHNPNQTMLTECGIPLGMRLLVAKNVPPDFCIPYRNASFGRKQTMQPILNT